MADLWSWVQSQEIYYWVTISDDELYGWRCRHGPRMPFLPHLCHICYRLRIHHKVLKGKNQNRSSSYAGDGHGNEDSVQIVWSSSEQSDDESSEPHVSRTVAQRPRRPHRAGRPAAPTQSCTRALNMLSTDQGTGHPGCDLEIFFLVADLWLFTCLLIPEVPQW